MKHIAALAGAAAKGIANTASTDATAIRDAVVCLRFESFMSSTVSLQGINMHRIYLWCNETTNNKVQRRLGEGD